MGAGIPKKIEGLEEFCLRKAKFQRQTQSYMLKALTVWKVTLTDAQYLEWPYQISASAAYIILLCTDTANSPKPLVDFNKTPIELGQVLFLSQFLKPFLSEAWDFEQNTVPYKARAYAYYGDSLEEDQPMVKAKLTYFMNKLGRCMNMVGLSICLTLLNEAHDPEMSVCKLNQCDLNEYVDFNSEYYKQVNQHDFFQLEIFGRHSNIKHYLEQSVNQGYLQYAPAEQYLQMDYQTTEECCKKQEGDEASGKNNLDADDSMPFACEITQINKLGSNNRMFGENRDESNLLMELGIDQSVPEKIQEFLKGLFLGTERVSRNFSLLTSKRVKLIVNCAADSCRNWFLNDIDYQWMFIPDPLHAQSQIGCLIYAVADMMNKYFNQNNAVLLHCQDYDPVIQYSGSRSAAVLIGVMIVSLQLNFQEAFNIVAKKWPIEIPPFMQKELVELKQRRRQRPKGFRVFSICSYSKESPQHLVAKHVFDVESVDNLQGFERFAEQVFICAGENTTKIMIGRECAFREQYEKYAKEFAGLLSKYEGFTNAVTVEMIDKKFRKQPRVQTSRQLLRMDPSGKGRNPGFRRNEQMVLKYPILRPVWEKKKEDGFYFTVKERNGGADVVMNKGLTWIGYEKDKVEFFDKIVNCYLAHVPHDKIWIVENQEDNSIFDMSAI